MEDVQEHDAEEDRPYGERSRRESLCVWRCSSSKVSTENKYQQIYQSCPYEPLNVVFHASKRHDANIAHVENVCTCVYV